MRQYPEMNLAKMTRTCERILQKRQLASTSIVRDLWMNGWLIVDLMIWSSLFLTVFLWFDLCFPCVRKLFVTFGIATSFERNLHLFPVKFKHILFHIYISSRTGVLLRTIFGKFCLFLSINCQKTGLLEIFVSNIRLARSFTVFPNWSPAKSRFSTFESLSQIHSLH